MSTTTEKQTAIEWLVKKLNSGKELTTLIYHAKEMEKQQIIDAFEEGKDSEYEYHINDEPRIDAEEYYNETFNK
jgi:methanogenic corrinoid protein MtbC1